MKSKLFRRQLLLSTGMVVAGLLMFDSNNVSAAGICSYAAAPTIVCSGTTTTGQTVTYANATVNTASGLSITTLGATALNLNGNTKGITFVDGDNTGALFSGATSGIYATSADTGVDTLALTLGKTSTAQGAQTGIGANQTNAGSVNITVNGYANGTGASGNGIYGKVSNSGTAITITTGASSSVTGGAFGIHTQNNGMGSSTITANGNVTGTTYGIRAGNSGATTDLSVTTGAGTLVQGAIGIFTFSGGKGSNTVTVNGSVTGTKFFGIRAYNRSTATNLSVTTGAGTLVKGNTDGIYSYNNGTGSNTVTANGNVTGTKVDGIQARNGSTATDLSVTTGAGTLVKGATGIFSYNRGKGSNTVTVNGSVTGTNGTGIFAYNARGTTNLSVTTGAGSSVLGASVAINGGNNGTGAFSITTGGTVANGTSGAYNANGLAIQTWDNSVVVNNLSTGKIIGRMNLGANITGNSFTNTGSWITSGSSDFAAQPSPAVAGAVAGTVINTGGIFAAVGSGSNSTTFNNLVTFTNNGLLSLSNQTPGNGATPANALTINGNFAGTGTLKIDASLGATGSAADTLTVNGNVTGTTKLAVVNTNAGLGALNTGTVFATVNGTAAANSFVMLNGPIASGLYIYDIKEVNVGSTQELFELYSKVGVNAPELAEIVTGSQNSFYRNFESVFEHVNETITNQQSADLGNGIHASPVADATGVPDEHGVWSKIIGNASQWGQGGAQGYNLGSGGVIAGLDGKIGGSDRLTLGVDAGYIRSYQHFNSGDYGNYDGLAAGVYAAYHQGNFRTDMQLGAEFMNLGYVLAATPGTINYAAISTFGGSVESGYRMPIKNTLYAEPIVRLDIANGSIPNGSIAGTAFNAGGTSVRGAVGVNFKGQVSSNDAALVFRPSLGFKVWQEFGQQSSATFNSTTVYDLAPATYGEVSLGTDIVNLNTGWSGSIAGTGRIADQYLSVGGQVSLRKDF